MLVNYLLITLGLGELAFAIYLFVTNPASRVRLFYALFVFGAALWVLAVGLFTPDTSENFGRVLDKFAYFGPVVALSFLLAFSWYFPFQTRNLGKVEKLIVFVPIVFFGSFIFFTDLVIKSAFTRVINNIATIVFGPLFPFHALFVLVYWTSAIVILLKKRRRSDGLHRWMLDLFLLGIIPSSLIAFVTNLYNPAIQEQFHFWYIGPLATVMWLLTSTYIVYRNK